MVYEDFEDFKKLAINTEISSINKVLRNKDWVIKEKNIFPDIRKKLKKLDNDTNLSVLDIGCGCSKPVFDLIEHCKLKKNNLFLLESSEMLDQIQASDNINKIPCKFPLCPEFIDEYKGKFDIIICYSVLHYVFAHQQLIDFIDKAASLLNIGGSLLLGDIPNASKHRRFVSSEHGQNQHKKWNIPLNPQNEMLENRIDDSVIIQILMKYRNNGYETYLLEQDASLPMHYVREDIVIQRIL